jgi:hypothetical protein
MGCASSHAAAAEARPAVRGARAAPARPVAPVVKAAPAANQAQNQVAAFKGPERQISDSVETASTADTCVSVSPRNADLSQLPTAFEEEYFPVAEQGLDDNDDVEEELDRLEELREQASRGRAATLQPSSAGSAAGARGRAGTLELAGADARRASGSRSRAQSEGAVSELGSEGERFQAQLQLMRKFYEWEDIPLEFFVDKIVEDDSPRNVREGDKVRPRLSVAKAARPRRESRVPIPLSQQREERDSKRRASKERKSGERKSVSRDEAASKRESLSRPPIAPPAAQRKSVSRPHAVVAAPLAPGTVPAPPAPVKTAAAKQAAAEHQRISAARAQRLSAERERRESTARPRRDSVPRRV